MKVNKKRYTIVFEYGYKFVPGRDYLTLREVVEFFKYDFHRYRGDIAPEVMTTDYIRSLYGESAEKGAPCWFMKNY